MCDHPPTTEQMLTNSLAGMSTGDVLQELFRMGSVHDLPLNNMRGPFGTWTDATVNLVCDGGPSEIIR